MYRVDELLRQSDSSQGTVQMVLLEIQLAEKLERGQAEGSFRWMKQTRIFRLDGGRLTPSAYTRTREILEKHNISCN